jgi:alpha-glucosidase (family GH31 glycosyl hydrolase)
LIGKPYLPPFWALGLQEGDYLNSDNQIIETKRSNIDGSFKEPSEDIKKIILNVSFLVKKGEKSRNIRYSCLRDI